MSKPLLVSFKTCPFLFKTVALAIHKGYDFDVEYIDLKNKPDWFIKASPQGRVPMLKIQEQALFDSNIISQYIDEITPPSIQPKDALTRALNNNQKEFSSNFLRILYNLSIAQDAQSFYILRNDLIHNFVILEKDLQENKIFFNGDEPDLVDFSFAPIFIQIEHFQKVLKFDFYQGLPKVASYHSMVVSIPAVQKAKIQDFDVLFAEQNSQKKSFYLQIGHKPLLVSFALCPYVQRARLFLNQMKIDYDIEIIDLQNKPEWFLKISPLGKVPVMKVGNHVIFESNIIIEYLDELQIKPTLSLDPYIRADQRLWVQVANDLQSTLGQIWMGKDETKIPQQIEKLNEQLTKLENKLFVDKNYLYGNDFTINDAIYAPSLLGISVLIDILQKDLFQNFPKAKKYSETLISLEAFQKALPDNFQENIQNFLKKINSAVLKKN